MTAMTVSRTEVELDAVRERKEVVAAPCRR